MATQVKQALVLRDENGTLYILPREMLDRCRVAEGARAEVEQIIAAGDVEGFGASIRLLGLVATAAMLIPSLAGHPIAVHADGADVQPAQQTSPYRDFVPDGLATGKYPAAGVLSGDATPPGVGGLAREKDPAAEVLRSLAVPPNVAGWPQLSTSTQGEAVRSLQYLLQQSGATLAVDGYSGSSTDAAVRAFQKNQGLVPDGVVGVQTWQDLVVTVQPGSQGAAVKAVQSQLKSRNFAVTVSGSFDDATAKALSAYQTQTPGRGLKDSGRVDHETWQALLVGA